MKKTYDVVIIGGGPCGLACGIEANKRDLSHLILEKGSITESIRQYPKRMTFFSTAENLEIGGLPFSITGAKPTRDEALQYYRKTASFYGLNLKLFAEVKKIKKTEAGFGTSTNDGQTFESRTLIIATGYFDFPRKLNIPGEELPHVNHYYEEPYQHAFTKVVIVGGGNSAIEAALDMHRHDVDVTIVCRKENFKPSIKYWLVPDITNRIKEGKIKAIFETEAIEINDKKVLTRNIKTDKNDHLSADFVYLLTGYLPDVGLLKQAGVEIDPETLQTTFDKNTYETDVPSLYLCGTVLAGLQTESIFIENGREHAEKIAEDISSKLKV